MSTDKYGYLNKYFVRWKTATRRDSTLVLIRWEVCNRNTGEILATFEAEERDKADAICKLMNSVEEETNDQKTMGVA